MQIMRCSEWGIIPITVRAGLRVHCAESMEKTVTARTLKGTDCFC